jgi:serine protease AprX
VCLLGERKIIRLCKEEHMPGKNNAFTSLMLCTLLSSLLIACHSDTDPSSKEVSLPQDKRYNPYKVRLDPVFEIRSLSTQVESLGEPVKVSAIPPENIYIKEGHSPDVPGPRTPYASKISPVLAQWLIDKPADEIVEIIITFKQDMRIPVLPELGDNERREDKNTRRALAIEDLKQQREASQKKSRARLKEYGEFEFQESFWIVNSMVAKVRIGEIERLSNADFLVYMQPAEGGEKPPADTNDLNDPVDARALIASDPYYELGLTSPGIGLMDTGVRETHRMLTEPDRLAWKRDCVNGGNSCDDSAAPDFDTGDSDQSVSGHGTQSAGVLSGNSQLGAEFRGVTEIPVDSWKIYTDEGLLDSEAALRALQAALAAFDVVLVGELQVKESETGSVALASDNAYDAGAIMVSANGYWGPNPKTVRSPAIAHKVLGIGARKTDDGGPDADQGAGPATDNRTKPDFQAPTESETASAHSDDALAEFGGTSGATPYAAATAMLSHNWLELHGSNDNGQTYAFMILYGQNLASDDNTRGAGLLKMATNGQAWWGKVAVTDKLNIDIPITLAAGKQDFDVALWWPESASQVHNNIDVFLIDPAHKEWSKGKSIPGIFERSGVRDSLTAGTWTIRIRGESVPAAPQVVYWAAHVRN